MSEFRWKHADFGVAGRARLISGAVKIDILDANGESEVVFVADNFNMFFIKAELIMKRGGGGEGSCLVGYEADGVAMRLEALLNFKGVAPRSSLTSLGGIVGEADAEFA